MQKRDLIQANASLENLRQNLDMKDFAKEILLEENYNKFIRSYKFTFWFQLIGVLAGFIVPSVVLLVIFKEFIYCAFGATIGIFWMCVWMLLSMVIPPTRIYRKCERYKGKVVYSFFLTKREYKLSDIAFSNEKIEEFYKDYGDGNVSSSWDKVTTFYNKQGEKLFKFGLAYDNVQLLVRDAKNTQRSISNQKKKN